MTNKRKGDKWILQGITLPIVNRNRKMAGIAETKVPAFARARHKKGIKDFLFGEKGLITFDEKRIKERVGIVERVLKLVQSMETKKHKKMSAQRSARTLWQGIRGRII